MILSTATMQASSLLIDAFIEGRSLTSSDTSSFVTSLLTSIVEGQRKAQNDLSRIEAKLEERDRDPYAAAMTSGERLLDDAAPAHRRPEDRAAMLADARLRFADAMGYAKDRRIDRARAEVMYGLTWLALGSPEDTRVALSGAAADLEEEMLLGFALACRDEQLAEQQRQDPVHRLRETVFGRNPVVPNFTGSDRFRTAQREHLATQLLRIRLRPSPGHYVLVDLPHGSSYSQPAAGLPIRVTWDQSVPFAGIQVRVGDRVEVVNERSQSAIVAVTPAQLDTQRRIMPDASAVNSSAARVVGPNQHMSFHSPTAGRAALVVRFAREEDVDLLALFHTELDESFDRSRRALLRR